MPPRFVAAGTSRLSTFSDTDIYREFIVTHRNAATRKLGFRIHAFIFVIAMIAQGILNLLTGPPWWALWVLLGWGIGLLMHGWFVLGPGSDIAKSNE